VTSQDTVGGYSLAILNPDGTNLFSSSSTGALFSGALTLPATGTYTIKFSPAGSGTGSLTFTLYNVPSDVTGTITIGGPPVTLTTTAPGQNGGLTFSGTAGQKVSLATSQNNLGGYSLTILNPDGTTLYRSSGTYGTLSTGTLTLSATGIYSITLKPIGAGMGSLTFTLGTAQ